MTLGTADDCSIRLEGTGIAPHHARLDRLRSGSTLRAFPLGEAPVWINGRRVPKGGQDLEEGAVLRLGDVVLLHRQWLDEEAQSAALPPLPGPVNSCHPTVVRGLLRLQGKRHSGGTFWLTGEEGCGRSVVIYHLRALLEESSERDWITGGPSFESAAEAPPDADPSRTLALPPLRNRGEDLLVLMASICGGALPHLSPQLVEALLLYDWPGNIRELRLSVARCHDPRFGAEDIERWDLPDFPDVQRHYGERVGTHDPITLQAPKRDLPGTEPEMRRLLDAHWWRIHPLAAATGQSRSDVLAHIFSLGIREPWWRADPGASNLSRS
ncbi:MAG: FHA domain-containing protein [Deltaproteobacteria bacterium]|nr:FHA domain-containing protein [Deltaproteobacteria bacterium]